jgi:undecaprenyl diphosphate synthase
MTRSAPKNDIQKVTDRHIVRRSISWSRAKSRRSWRSDGLFAFMSPPTRTASHRHRHGWQWPLGDPALPAAGGGHIARASIAAACVRPVRERGVRVLTVFAFSSENWNRPAEEVSGLMELLAMALSREVPQLMRTTGSASISSATGGLSDKVRARPRAGRSLQRRNTRLMLNVCFNYGGRWDIAQAAAKLAGARRSHYRGQSGRGHGPGPCADPDLLIRTGGEQRISNFLLWQAAYSRAVFQRQAVARF